MKHTLLFILFLYSLTISAQGNAVTASDLQPYNVAKETDSNSKQHFPEIKSQNNKIAEKINTFLQVEQLEHVPGIFKKHPFEKISYDENNCCSYVQFEGWERYATPKNILCLKLEGEASGAYPEHFDQYKSYNLTTGNPILIKDLLLHGKENQLKEFLKQKVKKEIGDYLSEIRKNLADPKIIGEDRERYGQQDTMYTECLETYKETSLEYYEYYFSKDSITFVLERCSNHAMRAIDDLYDYYIPIAYKDFGNYLTPYGKALIGNKEVPNVVWPNPDGKMYKGTVNKIPVTMLIYDAINDDGSLSAQYWYDKHKIPIEWIGTYHEKHFSFTEYNTENDKIATIEANWVNGKIIGSWRDVKTGKAYPLELTAY